MSQPPRVGPITGANTIPNPYAAMDMERFWMGKLSSSIDCERGCSAPPPAPCTTRASRITASEGAAPQKNEATVKMVTQMSRKRLRPKRRANQLEAGRMTALATR